MTGVYIRVQKCISRAEPSAPQKHTNAAQLSSAQLRASEIIRMQQGNKRTNVFNFRIPFAPSTVSIAIKWLEMKGSWGCIWYTFRFFSGGTDDYRIRSDGSILFFFLTPSLLMKYAFGVETACRLMGYHTWVSENTIPTIPTRYDDRRLVCTKGYRGKKSGRIPFLLDSYYSAKTFFFPFHSHPPFVKCAE
jgi:hypothetical protein